MCAQPADGDGGEELLALALSRPNEAMARARALLAAAPAPRDASVAHQVIGIVLREFGDSDAAVREMRTALRLARRDGSADREADVLASLGSALTFAGRTRASRNALNQAVAKSAGLLRGRVLLRRAGCLQHVGDYHAALDDLNSAIPVLRAAGDQIWEARALGIRALCLLALGSVQRVAADQRRAEELLAACGQELEHADAIVNRGLTAFRTGQLPDALACFDAAEERFARLGVHDADLSAQRCAALIAAGLAGDAAREADAAIGRLARVRGQQTMRAELLLVAADCALAAGDPASAADRAAEAALLFGRQGRRWWRSHAQLTRVRAAAEAGPLTAALLGEARRCVRELTAIGSPQLVLARLTAGRTALALAAAGQPHERLASGNASRPAAAARLRAEAERYLAAAATECQRGPALSRAAAWLARALRAEAAGDGRALMRACRRGLAVIDEFRSVFGSSELRARSTAHGAELAALGLRHAARLGRPRLMIEWSERWRAVALAVPPVRPPADEALQADLAALRDVSDRLARAASSGRLAAATRQPRPGAPGRPAGPLEQERQRLERAVRARSLRARQASTVGSPAGTSGPGPPSQSSPFAAGALLDALGDDRLIELVDVDGQLHALVCGGGRVRRFPVGPAADAARAVRFARQALRRVAHGPAVSADDAAVHAWLAALGERLDRVLLGDGGGHLGAGSVVIVPPGRLQAVPWGLLPRLRSRAVSVAPSATSWLRARRADEESGDDAAAASGRNVPGRGSGAGHAAGPLGGRVVLVRGPDLASGGAEVPLLASDYGADVGEGRCEALTVLGGGTATARRVLDAIDGAGLAHIAAHGTFRADSPLFSALRLDDGPLTVYDLERLRRGPRRLILSSCDSGIAAPAGADEVLGLASSLLPLGTAGIVASVVPVDDVAVVPLMTALHRELRDGAALPDALRSARLGLESDPVAAATGWSFICLGA
jgi:tetratricopeptide (TPR) repeat protein